MLSKAKILMRYKSFGEHLLHSKVVQIHLGAWFHKIPKPPKLRVKLFQPYKKLYLQEVTVFQGLANNIIIFYEDSKTNTRIVFVINKQIIKI